MHSNTVIAAFALVVVCLLTACGDDSSRDSSLGAGDVPSAALDGGTASPTATAPPDDDDCRLATSSTAPGDRCPKAGDADHDGVPDSVDKCPDTTPGVAVDASGCAITATAG